MGGRFVGNREGTVCSNGAVRVTHERKREQRQGLKAQLPVGGGDINAERHVNRERCSDGRRHRHGEAISL